MTLTRELKVGISTFTAKMLHHSDSVPPRQYRLDDARTQRKLVKAGDREKPNQRARAGKTAAFTGVPPAPFLAEEATPANSEA